MTSESAELVILKAIFNKLSEIKDIFQIKGAVATTLADFSKSERPQSATDKPMPKTLGTYTVGKYPCKKCGGIITWDNYSKEAGGQNYPDHLDENGELLLDGCPEYNK